MGDLVKKNRFVLAVGHGPSLGVPSNEAVVHQLDPEANKNDSIGL